MSMTVSALMPALRLQVDRRRLRGDGASFAGLVDVFTVGRLLLVGRKGPVALPRRDGCIGSPGGSLLMCQSGGLLGLIGSGAKVNQAATA